MWAIPILIQRGRGRGLNTGPGVKARREPLPSTTGMPELTLQHRIAAYVHVGLPAWSPSASRSRCATAGRARRRLSEAAPAAESEDGVKQVSLKRPLGIAFQEINNGTVFVAEVLPDSNAEASGMVEVGDEVISISLPFGDEMTPVEKQGLDIVESYLLERGANEERINLELRPVEGGLDALDARNGPDEDALDAEEARMVATTIVGLPYPPCCDAIEEATAEDQFEVPNVSDEMLENIRSMTVEQKLKWCKDNFKNFSD